MLLVGLLLSVVGDLGLEEDEECVVEPDACDDAFCALALFTSVSKS